MTTAGVTAGLSVAAVPADAATVNATVAGPVLYSQSFAG